MPEHLTLTQLPRALSKSGIRVTYQQVWRKAVAGEIPAYQTDRRWMVNPDNLPAIADILRKA